MIELTEDSTGPAIARSLSVYSIAFIVAAAYHSVELWGALGENGASLFHGSFVLIDAFMAFAVWRRISGLLFLVTVLTAEQLYAHGSAAWITWRDAHRIDAISCVVVIAMPLLLALVMIDRRPGDKAHGGFKRQSRNSAS
jgi:hypothetical protein